MNAFSPTAPSDDLVAGLVATVDQHIRTLVEGSYAAFIGPNTPFAAAFTGLLTLYIGLVGLQLLFGRGGLRVLELPLIALKIGFIIALTTSWSAYQTLVFNLLFDGPREIFAALLTPIEGRGGPESDLYVGLDRAYEALSHAAGAYGAQASPSANILQGGPMLGSGLLWLSAIAMLLSTVGFMLAAKIVLAFLIAIGPVFIALALFTTTRGLFEGWARASISFALAPLAASVLAVALLLIVTPFLDVLTEDTAQGVYAMGSPIALVLVMAVFAMVMAMAARACAMLASGFFTIRAPSASPISESAPAAWNTPRASAPEPRDAERTRLTEPMHAPARGAEPSARFAETVPPSAAERIGQVYRRAPSMRERNASI